MARVRADGGLMSPPGKHSGGINGVMITIESSIETNIESNLY